MKTFRVALAQINTTVGDIKGNVDLIIDYIGRATSERADMVIFPELSVTGYPPEDLLLKPQFVRDNIKGLDRIRQSVGDIVAVVGFVDMNSDIYNSAAILCRQELVNVYHKIYLPNYGVFDEFRYFQAGNIYPVYRISGISVGVSVCEDIWYPDGPHHIQALSGAELIVNINASPYSIGKSALRERMLSTRALDNGVILVYLNAVGGQDELIFDGNSVIFDQDGEIILRCKQFEEDLVIADLDVEGVFLRRLHDPKKRQEARKLKTEQVQVYDIKGPDQKDRHFIEASSSEPMGRLDEIYAALVLGTRDYVSKNGFRSVVIGLSGGIDSSLVACIAVDALGKEAVNLVFMPSCFTSSESSEDSVALAKNLRINLAEISIDDILGQYKKALEMHFSGLAEDVTEENLQARIRGNLLMALSNKFGWLVLTTGNKSEMSVGYATLYGDMAGGFAVIKDVPKTLVYELSDWRSAKAKEKVIPQRVLDKEPTAELRADQKDTDSLPKYSVLDPVLKAYIEEDMSFEEILLLGCEPECVEKVIKMVDRSEYKRRQAPPGIKITERAFGRDRRFPITNRYRSF